MLWLQGGHRTQPCPVSPAGTVAGGGSAAPSPAFPSSSFPFLLKDPFGHVPSSPGRNTSELGWLQCRHWGCSMLCPIPALAAPAVPCRTWLLSPKAMLFFL